MAPFGPDRKVLHGSDAQTTRREPPCAETVPSSLRSRSRFWPVPAQTGENSAPADPVDATGPDGAVNVVDPNEDAVSGTQAASETGPSEDAVAIAAPVRLGDRFGWCDSVQRRWDAQVRYRAEAEAAALAYEAAVGVYEAASDDLDRVEARESLDRALADYESAKRDYAKTRWVGAGLILGDVSSLSVVYDYGDDATLQVAIERAFEAFSSIAGTDTLAAFDSAHQATEALELANSAERSGGDEPVETVEAPEPEPAVFDASQGWLIAIEAVEGALQAAADAKDASDAAAAATNASRRAVGDADDAASQIYFAARRDGDWEALIDDFEAQLAAARSGLQAAEDFTAEAYEAVAAAEAAAEAARAAEQAAAAARALANQSGATEGEQAYWDMHTKAPSGTHRRPVVGQHGDRVCQPHIQRCHRCCPGGPEGRLVCRSDLR